RADALRARLADCDLCPRRCRVDRLSGEVGECGIGDLAVVASAAPHHGEEVPLSGRQGSGTVFFSGCNLGCSFCQNDDISQSDEGHLAEPQKLAAIYLRLQELECHNLNLVTPTHVVPMAIEALDVAAGLGLRLPLVFNTGGYDDLEVIRALAGVVDIYMPDAKFGDPEVADRFCGAPDYPEVNRAVLREMHRQVGDLVIGDDGLARGGLLVRHLVMPEDQAGTAAVMEFIARELSPETYVNLMDQYRPCAGAGRFPEISRRVTTAEMDEARQAARLVGITRLDDQDRLRWVF
ncbi:MAG: radical SAM protein, partial [Myxococcota bacterium]|nr:radical SAM protein [Myxococcota bacterium]